MRSLSVAVVVAAALTGWTAAAHAEPTDRPRLIVFGIAHDARLEADDVRTLIDLVGDVVAEDARFSSLTENEMRRAADLAATRAAAGCEADAGCIAEIADAMGARFVVGGRVARLGPDWILSLQLLDTRTLDVISRSSHAVPARDRLRDAVRPATRKLLAFTHDDLGAPPLRPWPWLAAAGGAVGVGVGVVAVGGGALLLVDASEKARELRDVEFAEDAIRLRRDVERNNLAGALLVAGGALVALAAGAGGAAGFVALGGLE